jgi:hypothetical protein
MIIFATRMGDSDRSKARSARDLRAADLQEKPTKRLSNGVMDRSVCFVGFDEDGGFPANIAASGASH